MEFSRDAIERAAKDWGIKTNNHIKGRKSVHYNILRNYAQSEFVDRNQAREFINYVKSKCHKRKKH